MSKDTQTLLTLVNELAKSNGDYISVATTTNITTNTTVVSTGLREYDNSADDYFNNWWVYINTTNNANVMRKVSNYTTATGTLTLYGANLAAESAAATIYVFRYSRTAYKDAVLEAIKEIYPTLHISVDEEIVAGNILPSLSDFSSSSTLTWYTASDSTILRTSTAGQTRNDTYACKTTSGAANGYIYISSDTYPRLLQLQGKTVDFSVWALPQTADDATMSIIATEPDGTQTTYTTTTSCPAGQYTRIYYDGAAMPTTLADLTVKFITATNGQYTIWNSPYLDGILLTDYLLPYIDMHVDFVEAFPADNDDQYVFHTCKGIPVPYRQIQNATQRYVKLLRYVPDEYRLRITGRRPLETLSSDTDTVTIEDERVPLLIALAKYIFFDREVKPQSSEDISQAEYFANKALNQYRSMILSKGMPTPSVYIKER